MQTTPQQELIGICQKWSAAIQAVDGTDGRIDFFQNHLPGLLGRQALFAGILKGLVEGSGYPDLRQGTLFDNELVLFMDPGRRFSLRGYIFGPGDRTVVHDHTSWGVSGSAFGKIEVVRYRREDDGSLPDRAHLTLEHRFVLLPGEIETILPFDQGIHSSGNPADGSSFMISIYGPPRRRLYLQRFNLQNGRVHRMFPQRIRKKMLAQQALKTMGAM